MHANKKGRSSYRGTLTRGGCILSPFVLHAYCITIFIRIPRPGRCVLVVITCRRRGDALLREQRVIGERGREGRAGAAGWRKGESYSPLIGYVEGRRKGEREGGRRRRRRRVIFSLIKSVYPNGKFPLTPFFFFRRRTAFSKIFFPRLELSETGPLAHSDTRDLRDCKFPSLETHSVRPRPK